MDQNERKTIVETKIASLIAEFQRCPNKFLTEEDLRSYLYHLLLDDFGEDEKTEDASWSISLHSEVRWYGHEGTLRYRSDLVILDVSQLRTKDRGSLRLPSKAYAFDDPFVIIELKLRRTKGKSDTKYKEDLEKDRVKLSRLRTEVAPTGSNVHMYLLGFDKKQDICFHTQNSEFNKEYYVYANNEPI